MRSNPIRAHGFRSWFPFMSGQAGQASVQSAAAPGSNVAMVEAGQAAAPRHHGRAGWPAEAETF